MRKSNGGFTLIELTIAIIIIGILAISATFYYKDAIHDSKIALIKDTAYQLKKNTALVHTLANAQSLDKGYVTINGKDFKLTKDTLAATKPNIVNILGISQEDWVLTTNGYTIDLWPKNVSSHYTTCHIRYTSAGRGQKYDKVSIPSNLNCS
ncbi:prepilin-type N-terminal cleavage/methylation domain-containing protein [Dongshaea marina]|uniref:prepilin-type N-terminal cleavage/methylation domain-containing protein n=1 Tax=Dongshaea marina TaxID=2047966 RepID=UPI000D3E40DC|nr:prepilin-type N-terminal cleavage/methylation domain-containing protein [Dongshaea marina]